MLTKENVQEINNRVARALKAEFGEEVIIDLGNVYYSANKLRFTNINFTMNESGNVEEAMKKSWDNDCFREGLRPEHYGKVITYNGKEVKLTAIHSRRRKFSIGAIILSNGKEVLLDRKVVQNILNNM